MAVKLAEWKHFRLRLNYFPKMQLTFSAALQRYYLMYGQNISLRLFLLPGFSNALPARRLSWNSFQLQNISSVWATMLLRRRILLLSLPNHRNNIPMYALEYPNCGTNLLYSAIIYHTKLSILPVCSQSIGKRILPIYCVNKFANHRMF